MSKIMINLITINILTWVLTSQATKIRNKMSKLFKKAGAGRFSQNIGCRTEHTAFNISVNVSFYKNMNLWYIDWQEL